MLTSLLSEISIFVPGIKKSQLKNALLLICCLLQGRSVCLYKLRCIVPRFLGNHSSDLASHYRRLTRFFCEASFESLGTPLLLAVLSLFRHKVDYLLLDGTCWGRGKQRIHLMTLSMLYKGVSIPIGWVNLAKKGTSSEAERIALFTHFKSHYALEGKTLIADREYLGKEWFNYLIDSKINFVIRLKEGNYKEWVNQAGGDRYSKMKRRAGKRKTPIAKAFSMNGNTYYLVVVKNRQPTPKEPLVYLLTTLDNPFKAANAYLKRWQIECCFKHLKSNGFNLEETALTDKAKIELLMALSVTAYAIAIDKGLRFAPQRKVKKYPNGKSYPNISVFRDGIDRINAELVNLEVFIKNLLDRIRHMENAYLSPKSIFV